MNVRTVELRNEGKNSPYPAALQEALGPPPREKAPSNRMSAAGISVFYGAFDMATARVEASVSLPAGWSLTGAAWRCARALHVLDLSELPPVPSIFAISREERGMLLFLWEFVKSITAPVEGSSS